MSQKNRTLNRIDQKITDTFTCVIICNSTKMHAKLINYNSISLLIFSPQFFDSKHDRIEQVDLFLGERVICSYTDPTIKRIDPEDGTIAIELLRASDKIFNPEIRCELNFVKQGILCGEDPLGIGSTIFFRIKDISTSGLRLITTKNNLHLTPGLQLNEFDLTFPGFPTIKSNVKIVNSRAVDDTLEFGCLFVAPTKELTTILQRNLIANSDANEVDIGHLLKNQKNFRGHIRTSIISGENEYNEILKLRWRAYRNEGKVLDDSDWSHMKDVYDARSLIYAIQIGKTVVATFRFVFAQRDEDLPFEKFFKFESIPRFRGYTKADVVEISRLAIDPLFQGSDIFVTIMQNIVVEGTVKVQNKYSVCLATRNISKYYTAFGAFGVSEEVAHPTLKGEFLKLYCFDVEKFFMKDMNSFGWFSVAKPVMKYFNRFQLPVRSPLGLKYYLRFISDFAVFTFARQKRKIERRRRKRDSDGGNKSA